LFCQKVQIRPPSIAGAVKCFPGCRVSTEECRAHFIAHLVMQRSDTRAHPGQNLSGICTQGFGRPLEYACRLRLSHPATGEACEFRAPLADDLVSLLTALEKADT
jgi:hypothetical protein